MFRRIFRPLLAESCRLVWPGFSIDVPSKNAGIAIAEQAATLGYEPDLFFDDETDLWSVYCGKRMIASYDNVVKGQRELNEIAVEHCSKCDVWVTGGN